MYLILKAALSGAVVVGISEIAKKSSLLAAILASLPLTSILAMIWLYTDSGDDQKVRVLSTGIFWMVLPSLAFFVVLPSLIRAGMKFYGALLLACVATVTIYTIY
ncbi:MAG: DUF3147 family protein, partial [Bacteriovoracia bacterium]